MRAVQWKPLRVGAEAFAAVRKGPPNHTDCHVNSTVAFSPKPHLKTEGHLSCTKVTFSDRAGQIVNSEHSFCNPQS